VAEVGVFYRVDPECGKVMVCLAEGVQMVRGGAVGMLWAGALLSGCGCGDDQVCRVSGGQYYAIPPSDWDGQSRLPVILTAHGYSGRAERILSREHIGEAYDRAGVLWLVPEGEGGSWATRGSPETRDPDHRDDVAFLGSVLDDVADRWPVDRQRVAASGFSQGGSMASELACRDPDRWAVAMPVSGTFWDDMPMRCEVAVSVRHTHGTADGTWPIEGRPISDYQQGSVLDAMTTWAASAGCDPTPVVASEMGRECAVYDGCSGVAVRLCLHEDGHVFPSDEADLQVAWLGTLGWW